MLTPISRFAENTGHVQLLLSCGREQAAESQLVPTPKLFPQHCDVHFYTCLILYLPCDHRGDPASLLIFTSENFNLTWLDWHKQKVVSAEEENNFNLSSMQTETRKHACTIQYWKTHRSVAYLR